VIDVAFTPRDLGSADVAVVVDVLRATTTVAAALDAGHRRVLCCEEVEAAERLRGPNRLLAGERENVEIPGFDRGNSPIGFDGADGSDVVLTTTNGSHAIVAAAARSREVILASLANLEAVLEGLPDDDVTIVCAGTQGGMAVEDVYVAGRVVKRLEGERTDAAIMAALITDAYPDSRAALTAGANAQKLLDTDQEADIDYCARESFLDVVPRVIGTMQGVAFVAEGTASRVHAMRPPSARTLDRSL
jgi:2-phosphosulfolactate phosphatase